MDADVASFWFLLALARYSRPTMRLGDAAVHVRACTGGMGDHVGGCRSCNRYDDLCDDAQTGVSAPAVRKAGEAVCSPTRSSSSQAPLGTSGQRLRVCLRLAV